MPDQRWYLKRLAAMGPAEVAHRGRVAFSNRLQRKAVLAHPRTVLETIGSGKGRGLSLSLGVFYFEDPLERVKAVIEVMPDAAQRWDTAASELLGGVWRLFGRPLRLGFPPNWAADPLSGRPWSMAYSADLDYRDPARVPGDIRWTWELNRLQELPGLALAFLATAKSDYLLAVERLFYDWVRANPVGVGVNWVSAMEVALRVHSLTWTRWLLASSGGVSARLLDDLGAAAATHAGFVLRHLSLYSSANNHLIVEAGALHLAGVVYPNETESRRWLVVGKRLLERELLKQTFADGVSREQSLHYHAFVLEAGLSSAILARRLGDPLAEAVEKRLEAMADFLAVATGRGLIWPQVGDADDGCVLRLGSAAEGPTYARRLLAVGSELFDRLDWLPRGAEGVDEYLLFVTGRAASARPVAKDCVRPDRDDHQTNGTVAKPYPEGGYVVMGCPSPGHPSDVIQVLFDAGPLGYGKLAAHGHADALSVVLFDGQDPVLIDPGMYGYNTELELRNQLRATAAHNTVTVEGKEQSEMLGPFLWGKRADGRLASLETSPAACVARGEHNGYYPIRHRRTVALAASGALLLVDDFSNLGPGRSVQVHLALHFHFAPEVSLVAEPGEGPWPVAESAVKRIRLRLTPETGPARDWDVLCLAPAGPGWTEDIRWQEAALAPHFGELDTGPLMTRGLKVESLGRDVFRMVTVLAPASPGATVEPIGTSGLRRRFNHGGEELWLWSPVLSCGVIFKGDLAHVRMNSGSTETVGLGVSELKVEAGAGHE